MHLRRVAAQEREEILHILFVCTGNICRSPTAERLAIGYGAAHNIENLAASSAGTRALIGHPMHPDSAAYLQQLGGDPSDFSARQLKPKIALGADLILTMARAHRDAVLELAPSMVRRTFTLAEASEAVRRFRPDDLFEIASVRHNLDSRGLADVPDPIGHGLEAHEEAVLMIADLLTPILEVCRSS